MNTIPLAFGWREAELDKSSGLDFLGLASPIEKIVAYWTPGVTNATYRARYFCLIPWIFWRYANQGGKGTPADQRVFLRGFETLLGYANVAQEKATGRSIRRVVHRRYCGKKWRSETVDPLPIRGKGVPRTPSLLDAAQYGPAFGRLQLLEKRGKFYAPLPAGQRLAELADQFMSRLPEIEELHSASSVTRDTVQQWGSKVNIDALTNRERRMLRELLFASGSFDTPEALPRVASMLLLLSLSLDANRPFSSQDIEIALAAGRDLRGRRLTPPSVLRRPTIHWRVACLLKHCRRASECAFAALYRQVRNSSAIYSRASEAATTLIADALAKPPTGVQLKDLKTLGGLAAKYRTGASSPRWKPDDETNAQQLLWHSIQWTAWCYGRLGVSDAKELLDDPAARLGHHLGADLLTYRDQLDQFADRPVSELAWWLVIDRGFARHNRVAATKLWQHDTFRLYQDEAGVRSGPKCPLAPAAIRTGSMLSLMRDLELLDYDEGYVATEEAAKFFETRLRQLENEVDPDWGVEA